MAFGFGNPDLGIITTVNCDFQYTITLMKPLRLVLLSCAFICLCVIPARADGILVSWSSNTVVGVTEQAFNEAKQASVEQILRKNLTATSWADAYLLMVGAMMHQRDQALLTGLTEQLTSTGKAGLTGTSRLIIWERITSGEILFEGKGYQVDDDLFGIAGRANWMLRTLTKKNFGLVHPETTPTELAALKANWTKFFAGQPATEYQNPYATPVEGLNEIRSRVALEALIVALKPSAAKDQLTKTCLQQLYHLDALPADGKGSPMLCSPDTLNHRYLAILTGVEDQHTAEWWASWWQKNQAKLEWKSADGKFVLKV